MGQNYSCCGCQNQDVVEGAIADANILDLVEEEECADLEGEEEEPEQVEVGNDGEADNKPSEEEVAAREAEEKARAFLKSLRPREAAAALQKATPDVLQKPPRSKASRELLDALQMQLKTLGTCLTKLGEHPGLGRSGQIPWPPEGFEGVPDTLLGTHVPSSPSTAIPEDSAASPSASPAASPMSSPKSTASSKKEKRDTLELNLELADGGPYVKGEVEFFPDGTVGLKWTAIDLPLALSYLLCIVNEIDLYGELVPFVQASKVLHQFSSNDADRLMQVVTKPPIPFVTGVEAVSQRFGFDLLDSEWAGYCLVEVTPEWKKVGKNAKQTWRGVAKPPPFGTGYKEVDQRSLVALGQPSGENGELTSVLVTTRANLKISRSLLPNVVITNFAKLVAKFAWSHVQEKIANFENSEHGKRMRETDSSLYSDINTRIKEFVEARKKTVAASSSPAASSNAPTSSPS